MDRKKFPGSQSDSLAGRGFYMAKASKKKINRLKDILKTLSVNKLQELVDLLTMCGVKKNEDVSGLVQKWLKTLKRPM